MKATRKLIPAIALLLVSAVLMSTASFAWFTMSETVTATGMGFTANAPSGILISTDYSTWAYSVDLSTFNPGAELEPVSSLTGADGSFYAMSTAGIDANTGAPLAAGNISSLTATNGKYIDYTVYLKSNGSGEKDIAVSGVTITGTGTSYAPLSETAWDTYYSDNTKWAANALGADASKYLYTYNPLATDSKYSRITTSYASPELYNAAQNNGDFTAGKYYTATPTEIADATRVAIADAYLISDITDKIWTNATVDTVWANKATPTYLAGATGPLDGYTTAAATTGTWNATTEYYSDAKGTVSVEYASNEAFEAAITASTPIYTRTNGDTAFAGVADTNLITHTNPEDVAIFTIPDGAIAVVVLRMWLEGQDAACVDKIAATDVDVEIQFAIVE